MSARREVARRLGGYEAWMYPTELGHFWRITNMYGPAIKLLGPQECVHYLTAPEARDVAAALIEMADDIEVGSPEEWKASP